MRDGVIQRFEYTFELSWKTLKRFLEEYSLEKPDSFTNKELFRVGFEKGLIRDPESWFAYMKNRNLTNHIYEATIAKQVYESAKSFLHDAQYLLHRLQDKIP